MMHFRLLLLMGCLLIITSPTIAQSDYPVILPMKERARIVDELLEEKVKTVLPGLMKRTGIDMWVVISREYNEAPVIRTCYRLPG
jgi:hypothetical protein